MACLLGEKRGCEDWPLLTEEGISTQMAELNDNMWKIVDGKLSRKFTAKNFQCALDFITGASAAAELRGHHPDLHLTSYRDVEVVIYSHSMNG